MLNVIICKRGGAYPPLNQHFARSTAKGGGVNGRVRGRRRYAGSDNNRLDYSSSKFNRYYGKSRWSSKVFYNTGRQLRCVVWKYCSAICLSTYDWAGTAYWQPLWRSNHVYGYRVLCIEEQRHIRFCLRLFRHYVIFREAVSLCG